MSYEKNNIAYKLNCQRRFEHINQPEIDKFNNAKARLIKKIETELNITKNMTLKEFSHYKKLNFKD